MRLCVVRVVERWIDTHSYILARTTPGEKKTYTPDQKDFLADLVTLMKAAAAAQLPAVSAKREVSPLAHFSLVRGGSWECCVISDEGEEVCLLTDPALSGHRGQPRPRADRETQ